MFKYWIKNCLFYKFNINITIKWNLKKQKNIQILLIINSKNKFKFFLKKIT